MGSLEAVRAVTQKELANRLRIGQGTLSKYENGVLDIPADEFVSSLRRELRFPNEFFYQTGQPYGFPPFPLSQAQEAFCEDAEPHRRRDEYPPNAYYQTGAVRVLDQISSPPTAAAGSAKTRRRRKSTERDRRRDSAPGHTDLAAYPVSPTPAGVTGAPARRAPGSL
jgi:transcriptional regulator with XRE-family HTH domain